MWIFNVFLVSLCVLHISGMVIKGVDSTQERDENRKTQSPIPEVTDVPIKNPESDSPYDVTESQLLDDLKELQIPLADSALIKRCARSEIVGSSNKQPTLNIFRRDVSERRLQQCERCRNNRLCKGLKMCAHCTNLCKDVTTTPMSETTVLPEVVTSAPVETVPSSSPKIVPENMILGSRFSEVEDKPTIPKYYSVGAVESEPVKRLFSKIFHVPESFEKFVVLGTLKGSTEGENFNDIFIIDLAQLFGTNKKTKVHLHRFENPDLANVMLINELNEKLDEKLNDKMRTGSGQLEMDEINGVIDEAMKEVNDNVGNPQERCDLDKAVDELIEVLPPEMAQRAKETFHREEPSQSISEVPESLESPDEIRNPPVIQDDLKVGNILNDGAASIPQSGFEDIAKDIVGDKAENEVGGIVLEPKSIDDQVQPETVKSSNQDIAVPPSSDNQIIQPILQEAAGVSSDLEKNVFKIVKDSLKAASQAPNLLNQVNTVGQENPISEEPPRQVSVGDTITNVRTPQVEGETVPTVADPTIPPSDNENNVAIVEQPQLESRSQFPTAENSNFGSLVPVSDVSSVLDPRMKKVLYVGENMNLPLKMFTDTDGVIKLKVDTDALCNCKNTTCPKKHIDEKFRAAIIDDEQDTQVPPLQVRFERNTHKSDDLMNGFMNSLHNDENLGVFKRSVSSEESEQMEIENEIEKLTEDIENYRQANKELLNKGTLALWKDVKKTKDVNQMITLANNFLIWMQELATKHLE